jgi:hypothetical protein
MQLKLNEQIATEMGGALEKLRALSAQSIVTTETAAERRGLENFLARALNEHAIELLGAWFTVQHQYRPLVQGFTALLQNALASLDRAQPKPVAPAATEPAKAE